MLPCYPYQFKFLLKGLYVWSTFCVIIIYLHQGRAHYLERLFGGYYWSLSILKKMYKREREKRKVLFWCFLFHDKLVVSFKDSTSFFGTLLDWLWWKQSITNACTYTILKYLNYSIIYDWMLMALNTWCIGPSWTLSLFMNRHTLFKVSDF